MVISRGWEGGQASTGREEAGPFCGLMRLILPQQVGEVEMSEVFISIPV